MEDENQFFEENQFSEENIIIKKEKKEKAKEILQHKLEKILEKLKDKKNKNLDDFLENGTNKKENKEKKHLKWQHIILQVLATYFNLVSVYQIISIMNSLYQIIKEDFLGRFIDQEKNIFFQHLVNQTFKVFPEIKIFFWSSMIGSILLSNLKLELSSFILFVLNFVCLFILYLFPFHKEKRLDNNYSAFELIELVIIYIILFLSVGGGSLFYYQKFISVFNDWVSSFEFFKLSSNLYSSFFIFVISSLSMLTKIELNYIIFNKFNNNYKIRLFFVFHFLLYVLFFFISFCFQFVFDLIQNDESFSLKCTCCNKCCNRCYKKEMNNSITVLKTKFKGCKIFGYIFYEENYSLTEIESNEFDNKIDYKIEYDDNSNLNDLYNDSYSIKILIKGENVCDWFCKTCCTGMMISLIVINFLIDLQVIGFTQKYSESLKTKTEYKDKKELEKYMFYTICYGIILSPFYFIFYLKFIKLCTKKKKIKIKSAHHIFFLIAVFNVIIILYSFYQYFNFLPNEKVSFAHFYTISIGLYNIVKIFWMNQLGQNNSYDFLKFTGLISLANLIFSFCPIILNDNLKVSLKSQMIIQIISAILCLMLIIFVLFMLCCCNRKKNSFNNNNINLKLFETINI